MQQVSLPAFIHNPFPYFSEVNIWQYFLILQRVSYTSARDIHTFSFSFLFLHECTACSVFVYLFQLACQLCLFTHTNSYIFSSSNCFNCSQKFWYFVFSFSSKILWFPFLRWHLWSMDFSEVYCLIAKCWEIFLLYLCYWLVGFILFLVVTLETLSLYRFPYLLPFML